jgi:hypothetical protein
VTRQMEKTMVIFPDEQMIVLDDPTEAEIVAE